MRASGEEEPAAKSRSCIPWPLTRLVAGLPSRGSRVGRIHSSRLRRNVRNELAEAVKRSGEAIFSDPENLPSMQAAYLKFVEMFPRFLDTVRVDEIRSEEYAHLGHRVCLDYAGFGLFSHLQTVVEPASSSFRLAYVSANLATQALYGAAEEGTMESQIRRRIMDYFRINDGDYSMVFTASKTSAVKLLAESYRFQADGRLLSVYDHHSESIESIISCAREKGAKVEQGAFSWPTLRICSNRLAKQLKKAKKDGLFVFSPQSRVTGAVYTYQWMSLAQRHRWHVLLDASALGPRDMEALGLSVFSPDFIVSSFYKVFGADPTGFGCLFIKKSSIQSLTNSPAAKAVGMVRIVPDEQESGGQAFCTAGAGAGAGADPWRSMSSFSGPLSTEELVEKSTNMSELLQGSRHFEDQVGAVGGSTSEPDSLSEGLGLESGAESPAGKLEIVEERAAPGPVISYRDKGKQKVDEEQGGPSGSRIWTLAELLAVPQHKQDGAAVETQERRAGPTSVASMDARKSSGNIVCRAIEQTMLVGVCTTKDRMRYLTNWLVMSLLRLRHPSGSDLVIIYGPSSRYDRGISVAFNICDWTGMLLEPTLVQRLADRHSISLGLGVIKNVQLAGSGSLVEMVVVTLSLGFLTAFEDVYKLWAFVARFLDADFVKREGWRYQALNQELVPVL